MTGKNMLVDHPNLPVLPGKFATYTCVVVCKNETDNKTSTGIPKHTNSIKMSLKSQS